MCIIYLWQGGNNLFKKGKGQLESVKSESSRLLDAMKNNNLNIRMNVNNIPPDARIIAENVNATLDAMNDYVKEFEHKYNLVTQSAELGFWEMDVKAFSESNQDVEIIYTEGFRRLLGYHGENEFTNDWRSFHSKIHPEDEESVLQELSSHVNHGRKLDVECRLETHGGEYKWFHISGESLNGINNENIRSMCMIRDIHEAKSIKEEYDDLKIRFDLYHQALTLNPELIEAPWEMTVVGGDPVNEKNEFWWSPSYRKLVGYNDEKDFPNVLGSWMDKLHPDDFDHATAALGDHLNDHTGNTPYLTEFRLKVKSGEYRWFFATGETLRDENGVPLRVCGTNRDITNIKLKQQLEEELSESMGQFTDFVSQMASSVSAVTDHAQDIANAYDEIIKSAEQNRLNTEKTVDAVELIKQISDQINLIGLNASIEAARVGESGKGFTVVANEVRKLATISSDSVTQIEEVIGQIKGSTGEIINYIKDISEMIQSQAATTEELSASVQEINSMSQEVLTQVKNSKVW